MAPDTSPRWRLKPCRDGAPNRCLNGTPEPRLFALRYSVLLVQHRATLRCATLRYSRLSNPLLSDSVLSYI